ncbi:MAG: PCYCGC domain-containing protein [Bacillus sp. (in: Bacteria)]|nr:PCYCGC domain-containing protein [Bacillus sp. (in: firmicutes)]
MAAQNPQVLASVPCYCGCGGEGHESNLDCFVDQIGANNVVTEWDQMGIS